MRMRKKPNLIPRMEACSAWWIRQPKQMKGNWRSLKPDAKEIRIEVGCGKGTFTVKTAEANPDILLIAVELCSDAMVVGMERAKEMGLTNVFFVAMDVAKIEEFFAPGEADLLYINFCDPWPRSKNAKRRLTFHTFLERYRVILKDGGEVHFKTDNAKLFEWSLEEFAACGLEVKNLTRDLHANGPVGIMTDYEAKFHEMGTPINRCEIIMRKKKDGETMLENLKKLNPDVPLFDVTAPEFATFGRILKNIDTAEIMEAAKQLPMPESGSCYQPSVEAFEKLAVATQIQNECYGSLPTQVGHCWGHSNFLNGSEWHSSHEINIAVTPLVLILGHVWDMEDSKIDSSKYTAFYLPAGTVVEIYATTLHFCPCEVSKDGFGCVVGLPAGTNTDLTITEKDPALFRKNKWIVAHVENDGLLNRGVVPGITGTNYEIKY